MLPTPRSEGNIMTISMNLGENSYDILVERGILTRLGELCNLNRRVLVVTDRGVPPSYAQAVASQCKEGFVCTVEQGEASKSMEGFQKLLAVMLEKGFSRKDCVVAVGGGVVGDLAGFAASAFMRGVDFYNVPTTLLSQIDSSIGGKTAINFGGVKNVVGAFYQPKKVFVDPDCLSTLSPRQLFGGLAEAIKMALTSDEALFSLLETEDAREHMEEVILRSLQVKRQVVEQDEREAGLRKVLNFGHTLGHGIEATQKNLYHGECVALGMLPLCGESLRPRLLAVLKKYSLYRKLSYDWEAITEAVCHDKKADGAKVSVIRVEAPGSFEIKTMDRLGLMAEAKQVLEGLGE